MDASKNLPVLRWDVSSSNEAERLRWKNPNEDYLIVDEPHAVSIRIGTDHTIEASLKRVICWKQGQRIESIELVFPATTAEDAYNKALALGRKHDIDTSRLEGWRQTLWLIGANGGLPIGELARTTVADDKGFGKHRHMWLLLSLIGSSTIERPLEVRIKLVWPG